MTDTRVLLVHVRPAAPPFSDGLVLCRAPGSEWPFAVSQIPAKARVIGRRVGEIEGAAVALVDVYPTPEGALPVCQAARARLLGLSPTAFPAGAGAGRPTAVSDARP